MLVKWLQNQHLVQAAEMGIRSYIDGVDDQSELRILKARQYMIGNDMKLDDGVGTCGKDGQGVPVGVGQPTLKMNGITVGGTAV